MASPNKKARMAGLNPAGNGMYEQNKPNNPALGFEYENMAVLYSFLTLKDNQALAREFKDAPKFDDVVVRETNSGGKYEYTFYQLKHKDTDKSSQKSITWNNLLFDYKNEFSLKVYYEAYLKMMSSNYKSDIKELAVVTTLGFLTQQRVSSLAPQNQTSLPNIVTGVRTNPTKTKIEHEITEADLTAYFEHNNNTGFGGSGKSYKFTGIGINEVKNSLMALSSINNRNGDLDRFLQLLRFYVNQPHVEELRKINESILRLYLPFYSAILEQKKLYEDLENSMLNLFRATQGNQAEWVCVDERNLIFEERISNFKKELSLGSVSAYESNSLKNLYEKLRLEEFNLIGELSPWALQLNQILKESKENLGNKKLQKILNLFNEDTKPTVLALKIMKWFDNSSLQNRTLIIKLNGYEAVKEVVGYFEKLEDVILSCDKFSAETFVCVLEVPPVFNTASNLDEDVKNLITAIGKLQKVRKLIRFIIVTQQEINIEVESDCLDLVKDEPLQWKHLPDATKNYLFTKSLTVEMTAPGMDKTSQETKTTSLKALGFHIERVGEWIDSSSLAELITQDEKSPLQLGLPECDNHLDEIYIERRLKLRHINFDSITDNNLKRRITFTEDDYQLKCQEEIWRYKNTIYHLLLPIREGNASDYVWLESSKPEGCRELENYLTTSGARMSSGPPEPMKDLPEATRNYLDTNKRDFFALPRINIDNIEDENVKKRLIFSEDDYKREQELKSCHLLIPTNSEATSCKYLWSHSSKPEGFRELQRYFIDSEDSLPESTLLEDEMCFGTGSEGTKLAIVVDLPGKGKSSLLTSLTNQYLRKEKEKKKLTRLLYRINLLEHKKFAAETISDKATAVDFLIKNFIELQTNQTEKVLGFSLIKSLLLKNSSKSVFLLFDGFDEIGWKQQDATLKMMDYLLQAEGICRIILTSRPDNGLGKTLENHFKQLILHLTDFSTIDQEDFLLKSWNRKLEQESKELEAEQNKPNLTSDKLKENNINTFAKELVSYAAEALRDEEKNFLDIPLQCFIVSECFYDEMKQFIQTSTDGLSETRNPVFEKENFKLLKLYHRFFETKIKIFFQDKAKLSDENEASSIVKEELKFRLTVRMERLAIFHMMTDISDAEVLCRFTWNKYRKSAYVDDLKRAMKLGMIQGIDVERSFSNLEAPHVKFIHRTFAEYLFAKFLFDNFNEEESKLLDDENIKKEVAKKIFEIILNKVLRNSEYAGVKRFFVRMINDHLPPDSERCPFAAHGRLEVVAKWPIVGHREFNSCLAELAMCDLDNVSNVSSEYDSSSQSEISEASSEALLVSSSSKFEEFLKKQKRAPSIALMLIHCLKEYVCRPDITTDQRKIIGHVISSIVYRIKSLDDRIAVALVQWFETGDANRHALSSYFFEFIRFVAGVQDIDPSNHVKILRLALPRVNHHRNSLFNFEKKVTALVQTIFNNKGLIAEYISLYWDNTYEKFIEQFDDLLLDALSLSTLALPYTAALDCQVRWFCRLLRKSYSTWLNEWNEENVLNPYTIWKTVDFLLKSFGEMDKAQHSKAERLKNHLLQHYKNFVNELAIEFDLLDDESGGLDRKFAIITDNWARLTVVLLLEEIMTQQNYMVPPLFKTKYGRILLEFYSNHFCCRRDKCYYLPHYAGTDDLYEKWLRGNLEELWQEGEINFVSFLFKYNYWGYADCLLFSDFISPYVPDRLSEQGLKHFVAIIKETPFNIKDSETLWSAILQEEIEPNGKHSIEKIRELKMKIQNIQQTASNY